MQVFNSVSGFVAERNSSMPVVSPDRKTALVVDHSKPITLARCKHILAVACDLAQQDFTSISIHLSKYDVPEDFDGEGHAPCVMDKKWVYVAKNNSLTIWEFGYPVYSNDNGVVCADKAALCDSLC